MDNGLKSKGGQIFSDLDTYFDTDNLTEDDRKLLAQLDAIGDSFSELGVEFTDQDIINNAALLGQMAVNNDHANNVECNSYTYVINVYQQDVVSGTHKFTRIYEFTDNVALRLFELFNSFNAKFIHRSSTESFAQEHKSLTGYVDTRQVNVYDLIIPEGFDIDATHYHYLKQVISVEPWVESDVHWSSELEDGYIDALPNTQHLPQTSSSPHKLDTRSAIYLPQ